MLSEYLRWMRFVSEVCRPVREPVFATGNKVVLETKAFRLRQFSEENDENPVLILPPQAGHHSSICDFSPGNSLVRTFLNHDMHSVYAIDWKIASYDRTDETLEDLMIQTDQCVSWLGRRVNLVGLCQGGWQGAMYTALFGEKVNTLTLAGSPIDAHADGGKIQDAVAMLPSAWFDWLVHMGGGLYRGEFQLLAFKMMNPYERFFMDYLNLYNNVHDPDYLKRYHDFRNWYEFVHHLPGNWYLQVVDQLFRKNNLIQGKIKLFGRKVDLKNIAVPLLLIAGTKDDITLPNQVFNAEKYVSTPPRQIARFLADSGHIGIFMGSSALKKIWPEVIGFMQSFSHREEGLLREAC
jgi:poly(3-hydroxybutyrate) depolymerase